MRALIITLVLVTGMVNGQIVNIPDANFKNKLVNTLCVDTDNDSYFDADADLNNDGEIQISEALSVVRLNVSSPNFTPTAEQISSLSGLNSFSNLEIFRCEGNNLGVVDLSLLTNLKSISCMMSQISSLNLSGLTNLETLYCDYNQLSALNITGLNNLKTISCYSNNLTALNLTGMSNLLSLECSKNHISTLNLSNTPNLYGLRCSDNLLNTLNVNFLTNLQELEYGNPGLNNVAINNLVNLRGLFITGGIQTTIDLNPLVSLNSLRLTNTNLIQVDASGLAYLNRLYAYSNFSLNYINIKNGNSFDPITGGNGVYIENNPNLTFICANESDLSIVNADLLSHNNTLTQVTSYCNYTPGGNYNTIAGEITYDLDNNGCDSNDMQQPNIRIDIDDQTIQGATFSKINGAYNFYTQEGTFDISLNLENPSFFNTNPPESTINFTNNDNNTATQNFCISANGIHPDLEVVIAPIGNARPGFAANYKIVFKNKGNQSLSGNVVLNFDDSRLDFLSASPATTTLATNTLNWTYNNLMPFENRSIVIVFEVNTPTDSPAVNIDDVLLFTTSITPVASDELPSDNTFTFNQIVVGSMDPNEITCLEGNVVPPSEIGKYLHYVITFENTGNYQAENVVVKDVIDTNKYDINSLQLLNTSHSCYTRINGNVVEFIFQDINLSATAGSPPVGGHGDVLFKIKSRNNLVDGDSVLKSGKIYFDYNAPITTNDAITTYRNLSNAIHNLDNNITIYPNPTNSVINIRCNSIIKTIELYDIQGRLLETGIEETDNTAFDISSKQNGIYFLKITSENGSKVEKIIKE